MTSLWLLTLPFLFVAGGCFAAGYWCGRLPVDEPGPTVPLAEVRPIRTAPGRPTHHGQPSTGPARRSPGGRGHVTVVHDPDPPFDWAREGGIA